MSEDIIKKHQDMIEMFKEKPWTLFIYKNINPDGNLSFNLFPGENNEPSYDSLQWLSEDSLKPTEDEFIAALEQARSMSYVFDRKKAYPPIGDQLDMIFHDFENWKNTIQEIKNSFPKQEN
jgi:hypothetical protein